MRAKGSKVVVLLLSSRIYQVLVKVTWALAPPCWLQPAPKLREEFLEEGAKESISNVGIVFIPVYGGSLSF